MSLLSDPGAHAAEDRRDSASPDASFRFVPKELANKCRTLIESYHAMHGYACLPDMLWQSDARDFIECHRDFSYVFKNASKTRCAKRANDGFVLIATIILSLEVLSRDFAGWGKRFPLAKRKAENLVIEFLPKPRVWLMDMYLYPRRHIHPAFINALAPPEEPKQAAAAKE